MEIIKNWLQSLGNYALHRLTPAIILLVIGLLAIRILLRIIKVALCKSKLEKAAHTLIRSVVRIALYVLLFLILASFIGIDVTSIVALASVLTLAVSLSIQNALANIFGGFTLLCTKPFSTGDFVEIAAQSGVVQEIGLTYTKMATGDNKLISVPNSAVTAAEIVNYTTLGRRRLEVQVNVGYGVPMDTVLQALTKAVTVPNTLEDPAPDALVVGYSDSAITYKARAWCASDDFWTCQFAANKNVKVVFDEMGIQLAHPHMTVHIDQ